MGLKGSVLSKATLFAICLAVMLAGMLFTGSARASKADDTLVVAFTKGLTTVDRLYSTQREGLVLSRLTDDGLFTVDPETLKFVPLAAQSYKWADDTTLDVTLRRNIKFHDGSPMTADDVVYTYDWMLNKDAHTNRGPVVQRWLKSVEKLDEYKVRFHLKFPYPMALRDMAISVMLRKKGTYDKGHDSKLILNAIGPYKVVKFTPGKEIEIERFKDYYAGSPKGQPPIKRMVFKVIPDIGTQQAELLSGGIDFMYAVPTDVADNLGHAPSVTHRVGPDMRIAFIMMDAGGYTGKDNPFTKLQVRRAMNYAIDKQAIVKQLVRGTSEAIHTACNPVQFGCVQDVMNYPYDPAKVKQLLKEAGYPNGFAFELWAYRDKEVAEALVGDLNKAGIHATLRYVPLSVLARARRSRETPAIFASYGGGGTADTSAMAGVFFAAKTDRNYSRDAEVSQWLLDAERTLDPKQRSELYRKALSRIAEQAYWVPLYTFSENYLMAKDVAFQVPKDGVPRLYLTHWK
jgi:peptide/nickel transport system substrate-binding protein